MKNRWRMNLLLLLFLSAFISGCEDDEIVALAKAQKCLDEQPTTITNFDSPIDCAAPVADKTSQQANIIKCSAYLMGGGLDTNRIVEAAKKLDDPGNNQESVFIGALTLNQKTAAEGEARANLAKGFCNATGVGSYQYLGNLAVMGTTLSNQFPGGFDPTNISDGDTQTAITNCAADPSCVNVIADSAETIAGNYCTTASAEDDVCKEVNNAIAGANGDTTQIGTAMLCFLEGKTWANGACS